MWELATVGVAAGIIGAILGPIAKTCLDKSIDYFTNRKIEEYRYDVRIREQASRIGEYLAVAPFLTADDDPAAYRRARQLAFELALYLPEELYIHLSDGIVYRNGRNPFSALLAVREHLLGTEPKLLNDMNIIFHAPNAGNSGGGQ